MTISSLTMVVYQLITVPIYLGFFPESGYQLVGDDWVLPALALVQAVLLRLRLVAVEALSGVEVKLQDGVVS